MNFESKMGLDNLPHTANYASSAVIGKVEPSQAPSPIEGGNTGRSFLEGYVISGHQPDETKHQPDEARNNWELIDGCGPAQVVKRCPQDGKLLIIRTGCGKRTCWRCAGRRRKRLIARYHEWVRTFKWPVFLTLTLRRVPKGQLKGGKELLVKTFHKLRRQKWWREGDEEEMEHLRTWLKERGKKLPKNKKKINEKKCGIWTVEAVEKLVEWYVHLHCLADAEWIPFEKLQTSWKKLTDGSLQVNVKRIGKEKMSEEKEKQLRKIMEKFVGECERRYSRKDVLLFRAMLYLFKNIANLKNLSDDGKQEILSALKKCRFANIFGLRYAKLPTVERKGIRKLKRITHHCSVCGSEMRYVGTYYIGEDKLEKAEHQRKLSLKI